MMPGRGDVLYRQWYATMVETILALPKRITETDLIVVITYRIVCISMPRTTLLQHAEPRY